MFVVEGADFFGELAIGFILFLGKIMIPSHSYGFTLFLGKMTIPSHSLN